MLLVALAYFTAVYLSTEAADTCPATTAPCIPGPPGRDGKDGQPGRNGQPGRDGRDGVPGTTGSLTYAEGQQLKEEILQTIRGEISMLNCYNTSTPQCRGTGITEGNPATSCREVYQCNPTAPSGYYWIRNVTGSTVQVFCLMSTTNCGDITGGWMRAAYINMRDPANSCPRGLITYYQSSTRICSTNTFTSGCTSVNFPTYGVPFTKVCGQALGYQYGHTDGFNFGRTIDSYYVEGLSVTHGTPRNHIWTFAAGLSKGSTSSTNCPCAAYPGPAAPSFVGENYFCESGNAGTASNRWYLDDPLWDSQGCASGSTCCNRGGPWFTTTLNHTVSDDIEVRWCSSIANEESGVEQLEIYIN